MTPLTFTVPIRTVTGQNVREHHMARARRVKQERAATCGSALVSLGAHWPSRVSFPCVVTFTRISPRLADTDNLAGACKSLRDQLAAELGITDSPTDTRARWEYKQELGKYPAVRVRIESADIGEGAA